MPDGSGSELRTHFSHALFTDGIAPSASSRAATSSASGSQTWKGSATSSVPATDPAEDQDQALGALVAVARPSTAPTDSARLLVRSLIYFPVFSKLHVPLKPGTE